MKIRKRYHRHHHHHHHYRIDLFFYMNFLFWSCGSLFVWWCNAFTSSLISPTKRDKLTTAISISSSSSSSNSNSNIVNNSIKKKNRKKSPRQRSISNNHKQQQNKKSSLAFQLQKCTTPNEVLLLQQKVMTTSQSEKEEATKIENVIEFSSLSLIRLSKQFMTIQNEFLYGYTKENYQVGGSGSNNNTIEDWNNYAIKLLCFDDEKNQNKKTLTTSTKAKTIFRYMIETMVNNNIASFRERLLVKDTSSTSSSKSSSSSSSSVAALLLDSIIEGTKAVAILARLIPSIVTLEICQPLLEFWERMDDNLLVSPLSSSKKAEQQLVSSTVNNDKDHHDLPTPTVADLEFDTWCDKNGIYRVGVQTITTTKSLGGRGLFATKSMKSGSVIASIPSELIVIAEEENDNNSNNQQQNHTTNKENNVSNEKKEWQVSLTIQIMKKLQQDNNNEWIKRWCGLKSLEIESLLVGNDNQKEIMNAFLGKIVGKGHITQQNAEKEVMERLQNYSRRLNTMKEACNDRNDIAKWYTLAMSRAAYLSKDWDYQPGIVPFFDMLNHCHTMSNTELISFGDFLDRAGANNIKEVVNYGLKRKDMLLVITKDVVPGDELLTQYDTDIEDEDTQLKLCLQYGIPPPPALSKDASYEALEAHQLSGLYWAYTSLRYIHGKNDILKLPNNLQQAYEKLQLPFGIIPGLFADENINNDDDDDEYDLSIANLVSQVPFQVDTIRTTSTRRSVPERRETAWLGDETVALFSYSGKNMPRHEWSPLVRRIRDDLAKAAALGPQTQTLSSSQDNEKDRFIATSVGACGVYYDGCLLNLYPDGGSAMRYHCDPDQGTLWDFPTAVVSVGSSRRVAFRPNPDSRSRISESLPQQKPYTFIVMHGDLMEMVDDCQSRFQHTIKPAENKKERASRASLVFKRSLSLSTTKQ